MTFWNVLYLIIIEPLLLIFESVFSIVNKYVNNPGYAIVLLSLLVNLFVLPLYKRADSIQQEATNKEKALAPTINHIKKVFSGDERFLMLQTYYRQNSYSPFHMLKQVVPLLLQIPFFIAAYNLLSGLSVLQNVPFGIITDLGAPDSIIKIGGIAINILPIAMTLINIISSYVYTKDQPLKTKIQLYGVAIVFLVLLYSSPSGLVLYWTLNNVFSLVKNIVMKYIPSKEKEIKATNAKSNSFLFFSSGLFLSLLFGFYIPSTIISSSPLEFINNYTYSNPVYYLVPSLCISFGMFVIWGGVFYFIAPENKRRYFDYLIMIILSGSLLNYFLFNKDYGLLSTTLKFEHLPTVKLGSALIDIVALMIVGVIFILLVKKCSRILGILCTGAILGVSIMGALNCYIINYAYHFNVISAQNACEAKWSLSTEGQNVIVIMMDRAISSALPYCMAENPELYRQFDGFTYYPNTVSFGAYTNFASPALFGGYEYTPTELNSRANESLEEKNNEALKVLPTIMGENGFDVTVVDPPYAGYRWIPDVTIFDDLTNVNAYFTGEKYNYISRDVSQMNENILNRNLFCYSVFRCAPEVLQPTIYNNGLYNGIDYAQDYVPYSSEGLSVSSGYINEFMSAFTFAENWNEATNVVDDNSNHMLIMTSNLAHEPTLLQEPEYIPSATIDNTEYDVANASRFTLDGVTMEVNSIEQMTHYQVNMCALIELGNFFDYLREQGCYDNSRIIVVSDHGLNLGQFDSMLINIEGSPEDGLNDIQHVNPLLLVKDFNSSGFTTSDEFMTNADVCSIAMAGIISNPVNPYTGNPITNTQKDSTTQIIFYSDVCNIDSNRGNTFVPGFWYAVHSDIIDENNWEYLGEW